MTRPWALAVPVVIVCLNVPAPAEGQEPPGIPPAQVSRPLVQGGVGLTIGVPVGDFSTNVDAAGGGGGHLDFALGGSPVSVGVEATYLWYGDESRDVPLQGLPDLTVEVTTSNAIVLLHGRVRVQKPAGRVRPYADGLVGFINLRTSTSFDGDLECAGGVCTNEGGDSVTHLSDYSFSAGGGVGVMFAFGASPHSPRLDVSLRYLYGGESEYLTDDFNPLQGGPVAVQSFRSRTDMLVLYVGIALGR